MELPSNPNDRQRIMDAIEEIVNSLTRQQAERDLVKEICANIKERLEFDPKELKKLARIRYNLNLEEVAKGTEDLVSKYTTLFGDN